MSIPGYGALRAILVCPDRTLAQRLEQASARGGFFEIVEDLPGYPLASHFESRLRQARPAAVLIDLGTNPEAALALTAAAAAMTPPVHVVGLHAVADAGAIVRALRAGATEFLSAPFEHESVQAAVGRLRQLSETRGRETAVEGKVYAFAAAKAGQGVTMTAANVAAALSEEGKRRVALIDLDAPAGTLSFCWRVAHSYSVLDALQHGERMDDTLWGALVTNRNGVDILLGPDGAETGAAHAEDYLRLLEFARTRYEAVVLDLPSVYAPESRALMPACDRIYVVCNPELPSLHLTRKALAFLEQEGFSRDQLSLVLNRLSRRGELGPQDMERVFNFPIAKVLSEDDGAVHRALTAGKPIAPATTLGREIAALAQSIVGAKGKEVKKAAAGMSLSALLPQT